MYWVYAVDNEGYVIGQKRLTDDEHLDRCIESTKNDMKVGTVHVNIAEICMDGYMVQGKYIGRR